MYRRKEVFYVEQSLLSQFWRNIEPIGKGWGDVKCGLEGEKEQHFWVIIIPACGQKSEYIARTKEMGTAMKDHRF